MKTKIILSAITLALSVTVAHANSVHDQLKLLDKKPLASASGKKSYKAMYAICTNPLYGHTTMYRVTNIRPHHRGNSKATLTQFNGISVDVYLDHCQIFKMA